MTKLFALVDVVIAVLWCRGGGTLLPTHNGNPLPVLFCPVLRADKGMRGIVEILVFCIDVDDLTPSMLSAGGL